MTQPPLPPRRPSPGSAAADVPPRFPGGNPRLAEELNTRLRPHNERLVADLGALDDLVAQARLLGMANAYPGLALDRVLRDPKLDLKGKASMIGARLDAYQATFELNPELDLLSIDLSPGSPDLDLLNLDGIDEKLRPGVLATLKAHQRVYRVTTDIEDAKLFLEGGFGSGIDIALARLDVISELPGFDPLKAALYKQKAGRTLSAVVGAFGATMEVGLAYWATRYTKTAPTVRDYLRQLEGYEELFGSQSFCDCGHCESILGPAAYFADLMLFVRENVLTPYFSGVSANDPLSLRVRRPDLWTTELTCANSTTLIPSLDIINEILENHIAGAKGYTGSLKDRAAVDRIVYAQTLAAAEESPRSPFHLPLERVEAYLGHDETTRAEVIEAVGAPDAVRDAARLRLTPRDHTLVTTPNTDRTFLRAIVDLPAQPDAGGLFPAFDTRDLLRALEVTRDELGALVATGFVRAAGTVDIRPEKSDPVESVQNDIERVYGLTLSTLDRLHRFLRLWRRCGWSIGELDLALRQAGVTTLTPAELATVAALRAVQLRLDQPLDEVCALAGAVPTTSATGEPSLFERRFNPAPFAIQDGRYPKDTATFLHPALRLSTGAPPAEITQHRLQAALGVNEAELLTLIRGLAAPLGIDPAATQESGRAFTLTAAHLSALYRHAKLARTLDLPVADLFRLKAWLPAPAAGTGPLGELAGLAALLDGTAWWKASGRSLDDLAVIAGTPPASTVDTYPDPAGVVAGVLADLAADRALTFADAIFAYLGNVTEDGSRDIIRANPTRFVPAGTGRYRLADTFDLAAPLTAPAGITLDPAAVRELLAPHHPARVLPSRLAARLRLPSETVAALLSLLGADLNAGALPAALHAGQPAPLVTLVRDLVPLTVLVAPPRFDPPAVAYLIQHASAVGLADPRHITPTTVQALSAVTAAPAGVTALDVLSVLGAYTPAGGFAAAPVDTLARVLDVPAGLVPGLLRGLVRPAGITAAEALRRLSACAALALRLGVGGQTLALIASADYDQLSAAGDALLAALRARFPLDAGTRVEPLEDDLRSRRRDALTDYLIHSSFPQFTERADLYQHFLIDVELQGCARTSRVVAATSSLQLYVYRVLMNLEQDQRDPDDLARTHVPPTAIPAQEWQWRRNYRVWEANRKVFLWPENYLRPELRDDKTPLFAQLEAELLQKPIDEQAVLDAYATYLAGFDEVSRLRIAGACHDKDPAARTDVLHLFGVTRTEPPVYYYRAVRNAHYGVTEADRGIVWEPWRRIDVQIGSRHVAATTMNGQLHLFWPEWTTKPRSVFENGSSTFRAYDHTIALRFTTLRLDGRWSPPQQVRVWHQYPFVGEGVAREGVATNNQAEWDWTGLSHAEPVEGYRPRGWAWDAVYPYATADGRLLIDGAGFLFNGVLDLYGREVVTPDYTDYPVRFIDPSARYLYASIGTGARPLNYLGKGTERFYHDYGAAEFFLDGQRMSTLRGLAYLPPDHLERDFAPVKILQLPPAAELKLVNGSLQDCVIDTGTDQLLLQGSVLDAPGYLLRRLGTFVTPDLTRTLFVGGVHGLLDITNQLALAEADLGVSELAGSVTAQVPAGTVDYTGAYGVYYREIFFHIPHLIATHLSAEGRYEAAQKWFHYLFDPTANEVIAPEAGQTPAERAHRALDRNWRYREFRGLDTPTLRKILTEGKAIQAYLDDPFNPYAIARLRLSAFQKSIVMAYVDNLLDWADSLFAQFTTESVNEATLLYMTAAAVLGERPAKLGDCGDGAVSPKDYATIEPLLLKGSQFLAELETTVVAGRRYRAYASTVESRGLVATGAAAKAETVRDEGLKSGEQERRYTIAYPDDPPKHSRRVDRGTAIDAFGWHATKTQWTESGAEQTYTLDLGLRAGAFAYPIVRQFSPVFCVPANPELGRRWDRVEEQLFKIRHCLDITGTPRALALFAPEIDPRLLVRARAAGLSLDDVLAATTGNLPPYRFQYLIERAKAHAATVQSFGGALLAALEKKDTEELTRLRTTHQQNLLTLATQARRWEVQAADDAIEIINRQTTAATLRKAYYQALAEQNLIPSERRQSEARGIASGAQQAAGLLDLASAIAHLVPQVGAPTAMKFGGMEIGNSLRGFGNVVRAIGVVAEAEAASAGLRAGFERRKEGWLHQVQVISDELSQLEKQLTAAQLRRSIAQRSLDLHEATMAQAEEVFDFYGEKFTGLGLYTWLASTMQRVHREAYNGAYAIARLAEQAYRFERGDETTDLLAPSYWDAGRAGLLAGERLVVDLQSMERRFIETNYRTPEVDQPLSLTLVDPAALVALRETGTCTFSLDEFHYDLAYPNHYRRKVKSVRLTIPCVTGPYTNVSATLTLLGSTIRRDPAVTAAATVPVPLRRSVSIATSTAQQDAGVFEFSFRDERYMPFEGAGAASQWRLTLPRKLPAFDYRTITDVILHVTYTAEADEGLRTALEGEVGTAGSLLHTLRNKPARRVFSLRHDFSGAFPRLAASPLGTAVPFVLSRDHFPMYLAGRSLTATAARLALVVKRGTAPGAVTLTLNGSDKSQFATQNDLGGLLGTDVLASFATLVGDHTLAVKAAGALGVADPVPGDRSAFDPSLLEDVLLVVDYTAG